MSQEAESRRQLCRTLPYSPGIVNGLDKGCSLIVVINAYKTIQFPCVSPRSRWKQHCRTEMNPHILCFCCLRARTGTSPPLSRPHHRLSWPSGNFSVRAFNAAAAHRDEGRLEGSIDGFISSSAALVSAHVSGVQTGRQYGEAPPDGTTHTRMGLRLPQSSRGGENRLLLSSVSAVEFIKLPRG